MSYIWSCLFYFTSFLKNASHIHEMACVSQNCSLWQMGLVPVTHLLEPPLISATAVLESSTWVQAHFSQGIPPQACCPQLSVLNSGDLWWSFWLPQRYSLEVWGISHTPDGSVQPAGKEVGRWVTQPPPCQRNIWRGICELLRRTPPSHGGRAPCPWQWPW